MMDSVLGLNPLSQLIIFFNDVLIRKILGRIFWESAVKKKFLERNTVQRKYIIFTVNLTLYHTILTLNNIEKDAFRKHCEKRRKCW